MGIHLYTKPIDKHLFGAYNPNMGRDILHIRLDAFFATVEQRRRPNLHGKSIVVMEPKGSTSGVVVSASREARKLGVKEGDSVRHAQRACPDAIVFKSDYTAYMLVFEEFLDMLSQFTPQLEPDSLGSAYMDVTAGRNLFGDPSELCARLISEISARLDMPLLIGCAPNKLLARIASGKGKWFIRVRPGSESDFLAPLPVSMLDAVTGKIDKRLGELGVSKIGELAQVSERVLVRQFGPVGSVIHKQALGIDFSPVKAAYQAEVIIIEHTFFSPLEEPSQVEACLAEMATEAVTKLRKRNLLTGEIMLAISNESGQHVHGTQVRDNMSRTNVELLPTYFKFKKPTDSTYTIAQALGKLLGSLMEPGMEVSRVRVELLELTPGESSQLCLIGEGERGNRLNRAMELLVDRFGEGAVFVAGALRPTRRSATT
jgi:DNA polymerase-4